MPVHDPWKTLQNDPLNPFFKKHKSPHSVEEMCRGIYKVYMGLIIKGTIPRLPPFSLWFKQTYEPTILVEWFGKWFTYRLSARSSLRVTVFQNFLTSNFPPNLLSIRGPSYIPIFLRPAKLHISPQNITPLLTKKIWFTLNLAPENCRRAMMCHGFNPPKPIEAEKCKVFLPHFTSAPPFSFPWKKQPSSF